MRGLCPEGAREVGSRLYESLTALAWEWRRLRLRRLTCFDGPQLMRGPLGGLPSQENDMRRYELVSGAFFSLLALVQLTRAVLGWPIQVAAVTVPVWASVVAGLVAGSFAVWAFRSSRDAT